MANPTGSGRSQADKERSKQMSRPVSANQAARTNANQGGRTNTQRAGGPRRSEVRNPERAAPNRAQNGRRTAGRPAPTRPARRSPTALLTWGTAALVLIIVVVLVVVKVTGGNNAASSGPSWSPASASIVAEAANVPASVFNDVGITSNVSPVFPPIAITGQKALTFPSASGTELPGVFFFGAEYCPHCAAERWAIVVALSRFGKFHNLGNMQSSSTDVDPNTQTFTFSRATYTSPYIAFKSDEYESNQALPGGTGYKILQAPTKAEEKLVQTYNSSKYFSSLSANELSFPFLDFGNRVLSQENYDPAVLAGLSRDEIASGLKQSSNPITQAIVASANYLSASVCAIDGQQPSSVCTSKGVTLAAKALKLS